MLFKEVLRSTSTVDVTPPADCFRVWYVVSYCMFCNKSLPLSICCGGGGGGTVDASDHTLTTVAQ